MFQVFWCRAAPRVRAVLATRPEGGDLKPEGIPLAHARRHGRSRIRLPRAVYFYAPIFMT